MQELEGGKEGRNDIIVFSFQKLTHKKNFKEMVTLLHESFSIPFRGEPCCPRELEFVFPKHIHSYRLE